MESITRPGSRIVTLTMNPALDITADTGRVIPTDKMRCGLPRYDPGGIAAGSAMLLTPGTANCNREDVERFFGLVADPVDVDDDQWLSARARTSR